MIEVILLDTLKKQNKTIYWLSKQTGISNNNLANLCKNKTNSIKFDSLEKICNTLNCDITDVLKLSK